jgi:hypothetical protein
MYVKCNTEALSRDDFCRGKAVRIKYHESVSLFLPWLTFVKTPFFCAVLSCYLWPIWMYHIFPHCPISGKVLGKNFIGHEIYILNSCTNFPILI